MKTLNPKSCCSVIGYNIGLLYWENGKENGNYYSIRSHGLMPYNPKSKLQAGKQHSAVGRGKVRGKANRRSFFYVRVLVRSQNLQSPCAGKVIVTSWLQGHSGYPGPKALTSKHHVEAQPHFVWYDYFCCPQISRTHPSEDGTRDSRQASPGPLLIKILHVRYALGHSPTQ